MRTTNAASATGEPGDDAVGAGDEVAGGALIKGHGRHTGHVDAAGEVLLQRGPDQVLDVRRVEPGRRRSGLGQVARAGSPGAPRIGVVHGPVVGHCADQMATPVGCRRDRDSPRASGRRGSPRAASACRTSVAATRADWSSPTPRCDGTSVWRSAARSARHIAAARERRLRPQRRPHLPSSPA